MKISAMDCTPGAGPVVPNSSSEYPRNTGTFARNGNPHLYQVKPLDR